MWLGGKVSIVKQWERQGIVYLRVADGQLGFPGGSEITAPACNVGDLGSILGLGRFPGEGNGNPLQYSCLENPMDGGAWWATVHGVAKSRTWLSDFQLWYIKLRLKNTIVHSFELFLKMTLIQLKYYIYKRTYATYV